jgi:hypothetical protein
MTSNESVQIEYQSKSIKPMWGGSKIEVVYSMKHIKYGRVNSYKITCEVNGLEFPSDSELRPVDSEFIGNLETDSNDETLTVQGALDLFENSIH